jgi:hypothetical protein
MRPDRVVLDRCAAPVEDMNGNGAVSEFDPKIGVSRTSLFHGTTRRHFVYAASRPVAHRADGSGLSRSAGGDEVRAARCFIDWLAEMAGETVFRAGERRRNEFNCGLARHESKINLVQAAFMTGGPT